MDLKVKEHIIVLPKRAHLKTIAQEFSETNHSDPLSVLFIQDYSNLLLKPKSENRPLLVCHDGRVLFEAFGPRSAQAQDFLTTIAEPISRPSHIHEYKLTAYSLYAAVAVGMDTDTILNVLDQFSKASIPQEVASFIRDCTVSYAKVKLVLKRNSYFIESPFPDILRKLLKDETIAQAKISSTVDTTLVEKKDQDEGLGAVITLDHNDDDDTLEQMDLTQSFEIQQSLVEEVKKRCGELDFPLMEEYDFRNDDVNPNLDIDLNPKCIIRDYQEKSLSKMFGGGRGRARSGIIVLPTGAGKTLVGITAACTVKKSTLVLCTNAISVEQWANEFQRWSTIKESQIAKFTANSKAKFAGEAGIVISTYTMITHSGRRAWETTKMIEFLNSQEWGLLILDEVHVVPANVFRKVLTMVAAHTKLGLTATLVREDDKIQDLNFLIGPKLFEANWMDLANRGHIAKVEVV
jgi:DNA excision repair protein ERCC-3